MKLSALLKNIPIKDDNFFNDVFIQRLCADSRKVLSGDLFFAYRGLQADSRKYIDQAVLQGAAAVAYDDTPDFVFHGHADIPILPIKNLPNYLGEIASTFYGFPSSKMKMIGVTGTNGKTTCTQIIAQTFQSMGIPCGVIGTLGYGFPPEVLIPNTQTTPDPITLQSQLYQLEQAAQTKWSGSFSGKKPVVAMEVSSHALQQNRVQGIKFEIGIFTNLSHDHLDYHETMENYWNAKLTLFENYGLKHAIVNLDDPYGRDLVHRLKGKVSTIGYTVDPSMEMENFDIPIVSAHQIRLSSKGIQAKIVTPWGEGLLKSPLFGRFNLSNLLASFAAICALMERFSVESGVQDDFFDFQKLLSHLSESKTIPGRMQMLGGKKQPLVVIDYAHTPDALKQSLMALREHVQGRLWCVFGCGGDRDQGKRPLMGKMAEQYSDQLIITDDNPRSEDPRVIINQIISGLFCPWAAEIEHDRRIAIAHAIECAQANDIILIAGKGHEHYQYVLDKKIKFNDFEQAQLALAEREPREIS